MRLRKISSREEILRGLQSFASENGRPPKRSEPGFETFVYAAKKEFGSWEYALKIAGLQTYEAWKSRKTALGEIRNLLNCNPMSSQELREKLKKNPRTAALASRVHQHIQHAAGIESIGPRRNKIYFLLGQERIAQTRLDKVFTDTPELEEELFCHLRIPMTRKEVTKLLAQKPGGAGKAQVILRELQMAGLIYRARFVAGNKGGKKYSSWDLFGNMACKTYFCRFDCPEEMAGLLVQNIPLDKTREVGFRCSLTQHLKQILHQNAVDAFERKLAFAL